MNEQICTALPSHHRSDPLWSPADSHCLTCADEAIPVKVVRVDWKTGLALVIAASDQAEEQSTHQEEIDIMLVEDVAVGDILLAHGGVAIAHLEKEEAHERWGI